MSTGYARTGLARVIDTATAAAVDLDGLGVRFLLGADAAGGRFSLVEHPLAPRTLGAAMHTHANEDEYSFVLEGRVGVRVGDDEVDLVPGQLIVKPRAVPHAFWNASDEPARLLEIISPAGFERFFEELDALMHGAAEPEESAIDALLRRYGVEMDFASGAQLSARHGLRNQF